MEEIIFFGVVLGIPAIFLVLSIVNVVKIIKTKRSQNAVKKSLIIKTTVFCTIFALILIFYIWVMYVISNIELKGM